MLVINNVTNSGGIYSNSGLIACIFEVILPSAIPLIPPPHPPLRISCGETNVANASWSHAVKWYGVNLCMDAVTTKGTLQIYLYWCN